MDLWFVKEDIPKILNKQINDVKKTCFNESKINFHAPFNFCLLSAVAPVYLSYRNKDFFLYSSQMTTKTKQYPVKKKLLYFNNIYCHC